MSYKKIAKKQAASFNKMAAAVLLENGFAPIAPMGKTLRFSQEGESNTVEASIFEEHTYNFSVCFRFDAVTEEMKGSEFVGRSGKANFHDNGDMAYLEKALRYHVSRIKNHL